MQYNAHQAHASAVRAAAVAPHRPPAACAAAAAVVAVEGNKTAGSAAAAAAADHQKPDSAAQQPEQQQQADDGKVVRCSVCGSLQDSSSSSCSNLAADYQQQQQTCRVCGRQLRTRGSDVGSSGSSSSGGQPLPGVNEITPLDAQQAADASCRQGHNTSSSSKQLQRGWWQRMTSPFTTSWQQQQQQQQQPLQRQQHAGVGHAGALPGSWGPQLRPYPAQSPENSKADQTWQQQHQRLPWSLSYRDASIGRSVMWAGEFVHIIRPVVYVTLLKRYGLSSWKPWLTMLALDAASGVWLYRLAVVLGQQQLLLHTRHSPHECRSLYAG